MPKAEPQDVKDLSAELDALNDAKIGIYLDIAASMIKESAWEGAFKNAHRLLAAHLLTLSERQGASGPVTSVSVGQVSVSYGATPGEQDELNSTSYGQMYLALRRATIVAPIVI